MEEMKEKQKKRNESTDKCKKRREKTINKSGIAGKGKEKENKILKIVGTQKERRSKNKERKGR